MSLFDTIADYAGSLSDKLFGGSSTATPSATKIPTSGYKTPTVVVTKAAAKTSVSVPTVSAPASSGFSLNEIGDFITKVGTVAEKGLNTFFTAKSKIEELKTAQKIEDVKLQALVSSAQSAPAPAQIVMPSVADWINNPQAAAQMMYPAAVSGATSLVGVLPYVLGGAALLYVAFKRS